MHIIEKSLLVFHHNKHRLSFIFLVAITGYFVFSCANPMTPGGGPKDTTPPDVDTTHPPNYSSNFSSKSIELVFEEYVQLNNPNQQVIISPPMSEACDFKIKGKSVVVQINDSLRSNATYTFFFGEAISDITENNKLPNYQYVFSTGAYIDSLELKGHVYSAFDLSPVEGAWIMLYENDIDSLPLLQPPLYVTKSFADGSFSFNTLRDQDYKIFALLETDNNYIYGMQGEQIAFSDTIVKPVIHTIDSADSLIVLKDDNIQLYLFEEIDSTQRLLEAKLIKEKLVEIAFAFPVKEPIIRILDDGFNNDWLITEMGQNRDTIRLWISEVPSDTLSFILGDITVMDTIEIEMVKSESGRRAGKQDDNIKALSYKSSATKARPHNPFKPVNIKFDYPLIGYDFSRALLISGEDTVQPQIAFADSIKKSIEVSYPWKENFGYRMIFPDSTLTNLMGWANDTIAFSFNTLSASDYGEITLNMETSKEGQQIVQLVDEKDKVLRETIINESTKVTFKYLPKGKFLVKIIKDANRNGKWDTGIYLKGVQPENVVYFQKVLDIRPNWITEESISY